MKDNSLEKKSIFYLAGLFFSNKTIKEKKEIEHILSPETEKAFNAGYLLDSFNSIDSISDNQNTNNQNINKNNLFKK